MEVDTLKAIADSDKQYSSLAEKYADQLIACALLYEQYFGFVFEVVPY